MNGLLFPGQGSQGIGMGKDLYDNLPVARELLDKANAVLGYDLKTIMFRGPLVSLTDTKYAQPAIFTCSAMYLAKLKEQGLTYDYVAGHSLGEYNALLAAGVFDFETGLFLVKRRGEAMSRQNGKGSMAAVLGLSEEELSALLTPGVVVANLNSKTQIVVSGEETALDNLETELSGNETVKIKRLQVSAAFHSPQMIEASEEMKAIIEKTVFHSPLCNVVSNVTGNPSMNVDEIKDSLISQITGQVRWYDTIMSMKDAGVDLLYEVGYGDVLKKMNKTITFRPKCVGVEV